MKIGGRGAYDIIYKAMSRGVAGRSPAWGVGAYLLANSAVGGVAPNKDIN